MPEIPAKDPSLKLLNGLHLWHAPMSSCSQRVRVVLDELNLSYQSHVVNLEKDEHASAEYQAIHPKGLVPALVDDGRLYIESIDVIKHLAGEHSPLFTKSSTELLQLADSSQLDLKLLTFEFLFRGGPKPPESATVAFQQNHQNEWLCKFRKSFAEGFARDDIDNAVIRTRQGFQQLEARLCDGRDYLSGSEFSLSDVAWMPNVHRFSLMSWPFDQTPFLQQWFKRIIDRDSYKSALLSWQNESAMGLFSRYTQSRQQDKTDITRYGDLSSMA